ncbi:MAG: bifunctional oligoribonuclease/PAP phosphatase NrnA [Candidatus Omnitrophica bacterium]|nr:bifunctional oligoribonuclease/PAP phosphatase NrnA [Candidatus Omnitrophota bacterium]
MSEQSIISALKKYKSFAVTMHVNPDPDALASAITMALFLKARGKKVRIFNQDECPSWLSFVPRSALCEKFNDAIAFKPEVVIIMDCGELSRIGTVARLVMPGVKVINIDHHVTSKRFGDWNLVQTGYSSTSEILYQLLKKAGCRFTKDMAVLLYLGILTDTGSFGYDCTGPHTHETIAELLRFNFSVSDLYRQVYETLPRHDLKAFLKLAGKIELFFDDRVAALVLSKKTVARFSGEFDLKDKVFNFLRSVKGLEVIVIIAEQERAKTRLNFRSRGAFDVAELASTFGGGGHKKASGGMYNGDMKKAKAGILAEIRKRLS